MGYPRESDVLAGVQYGDNNEFTGWYVPPVNTDVKAGVSFGVDDNGQLDVPSPSDVRDGHHYGDQIGNLYIPNVQYVKDGTNYGSIVKDPDGVILSVEKVGNVILPDPGDVRDMINYGADGNEFTGNVIIPQSTDVILGVQYGYMSSYTDDNGDTVIQSEMIGEYVTVAPENVKVDIQYGIEDLGQLDVPLPSDVRSGHHYGVLQQEIGTLYIPLARYVVDGTNYGSIVKNPDGSILSVERVGTVVVPEEANVRDGINYGQDGNEFTGNIVLPDITNVIQFVQYGSTTMDGSDVVSEMTGTYITVGREDVRKGVSFADGEKSGRLVLPAITDVAAGVAFGTLGEFVGTASFGSGPTDWPAVGDVRQGVSYFGSSLTGTLAIPPAGPTDWPDISDVRQGVSYFGDSLSGTLVLPNISKVLDGTIYGSNSEYTGNLVVNTDWPSVGDVRQGISFNGGSSTGVLSLPNVSNVTEGVVYGNGSEFTGTLVILTDWPSAGDVRQGVSFYGGAIDGTLSLPSATDVKAGTAYGNGSEFTGSLVVHTDWPSAGDVRQGISFYGNSIVGSLSLPNESRVSKGIVYGNGTEFTGTLDIPTDWPKVSDVRQGISFLNGSLTGNLILPNLSNVMEGIAYGSSSEFTGTLNLPVTSDVRNTIKFGPSDSLTGSLVVPVADTVKLGIIFDNGIVGTLAPDGSTPADINLPAPNKVLSGIVFGPNNSLQGTLVPEDYVHADYVPTPLV
jgi:hypothetical protein